MPLYSSAIINGMEALKQYHDDSTANDPSSSIIDIYNERPLPYIIGTADFLQDENLGLGDPQDYDDDDGDYEGGGGGDDDGANENDDGGEPSRKLSSADSQRSRRRSSNGSGGGGEDGGGDMDFDDDEDQRPKSTGMKMPMPVGRSKLIDQCDVLSPHKSISPCFFMYREKRR